MKKIKCGFCGRKHNYYLRVEGKLIASAVCKDCEKYLNQNVTKEVNQIVKKNTQGQSDILVLGFIGYLVLMVIVLLCIF